MDKQQLNQFSTRLIEGGVAYRHVKRSLRELQDHNDDLQQQMINDGFELEVAREISKKKNGSLEVIAREILTYPELKSIGYRYPVVSMVFGPVVSYVLLSLLLLFVVGLVSVLAANYLYQVPPLAIPFWVKLVYSNIRFLLMYLLPLFVLMTFCVYASRNRIPMKYFGWGLVILCVISSGFSIYVQWPDLAAGTQGSIGGTLAYTLHEEPELIGTYGNKLRLLVSLLFTALFILYLKGKRVGGQI